MVCRSPRSGQHSLHCSAEQGRPSGTSQARAFWITGEQCGDIVAVIIFLWDRPTVTSPFHTLQWVVFLLFAVYGTAWVCEVRAQSPAPKVKSIDIQGNKRIELPAIAGRLTLKAGDAYTPENVRGQVKILYDTGFFEDVQVETDAEPEGIAVVFMVRSEERR